MTDINLDELLEKARAEPMGKRTSTLKGTGAAQLMPVIEELRAKKMGWRDITEWLTAAGFTYTQLSLQAAYSRILKERAK